MKNIIILILLVVAMVSCGKKQDASFEDALKSSDIAVLKQKKHTIEAEEQKLANQIKQLNERIEELEPNKNIPLITTAVVKNSVFNHYLELQGNVATKKNVLVYPETPGQIIGIYVKEGQYVRKGQTLAKIDAGGLSNQLAQLKSGAALAETTYERQKRLWNQKIGSEIQFLQAKTNFESQQNAVKQLERTLGKYTVKAPFSGVVDDVMKEAGTVVAPGLGSELFRVVNLSNMYIESDVPETYITSITKGKEVKINFPILGKEITSKVRQVGNYINPANRTFKVEIAVPNNDKAIKPNLTAKLKINDYTNKNAILVPQSIISENASGKQYLYVVEGLKNNIGIAKQVIVKTGKTQGDAIEVLEGLKPNQQIVIEGARTVKDKQEVEISTYKNN